MAYVCGGSGKVDAVSSVFSAATLIPGGMFGHVPGTFKCFSCDKFICRSGSQLLIDQISL